LFEKIINYNNENQRIADVTIGHQKELSWQKIGFLQKNNNLLGLY